MSLHTSLPVGLQLLILLKLLQTSGHTVFVIFSSECVTMFQRIL